MEGMRTLIRGSLAKSLSAVREEDRLAGAWLVACGVAMAEHGEVSGYVDGVVQVTVSDAQWMRQMESMSGVLQRELARIAAVRVTAIHFETGSLKRGGF
ncbi:MAG TPA: DciA family protein [Terracidiphilus sp.]|jgi:pheromone shutdown protein TraB|nr:DciA family protein [Terracidiphilus sp.]